MPYSTDVTVSRPLTRLVAAYGNGKLIADRVCPIIRSDSKTGTYKSEVRSDSTDTQEADLLPEDGPANRIDHSYSSTAYACVMRGLKEVVPASVISRADAPLRPLQDAAMKVMLRTMLKREQRVFTLLTTSGNYTSSGAATDVWTDESLGAPLDDFNTATAAIPPDSSGASKICAVMVKEAWQALRKHPQLRGGGALSPVLSLEEAADRLGVDEIIVTDLQKTATAKGVTATYSRMWTSTVCAVISVPRGEPMDRQPMFAGTFREWLPGSGSNGLVARQFSDASIGSSGAQTVQVAYSEVPKVIQADMGYLLTSVIA